MAEIITEPWRVLRVLTGKETDVQLQLDRAEVEALTPMVRVKRLPHGSSKPAVWTERPIFPGYVLLKCDVEERGAVVRHIPYVIEYLRFGHVLAQVEQAEIDRVKLMTASGLPLFPRLQLRTGQTVRVKFGSLVGLIGQYLVDKSEELVVVNLPILGRSIATQMPWDMVEPVTA